VPSVFFYDNLKGLTVSMVLMFAVWWNPPPHSIGISFGLSTDWRKACRIMCHLNYRPDWIFLLVKICHDFSQFQIPGHLIELDYGQIVPISYPIQVQYTTTSEREQYTI
jgi:hypothetical protein